MKKFLYTLSIILLIGAALGWVNDDGFAKSDSNSKSASLNKTTVLGNYATFDINRVFNFVENDGTIMTDDNPLGYAMQWPGQSGICINYNGGIWIAGKVNGEIRSAAAEYVSEFLPGPVINWDPANPAVAGVPDDPNAEKNKIFKIRYDSNQDLIRADFTRQSDYDAYQECRDDYLNWPKDEGAPVNADGNPLMLGDQVLWYVCNDLSPTGHQLWSTPPLGLELQVTVWGYRRADQLGDMMFVKFVIINKGGNTIDSAYVSIFDDVDLGDANDDYIGCDTTLSLGYNWNAGQDNEYGVECPAIGIDFFQGPIVPSEGDVAYVSGRLVPGYRNLPMTSFAKYIRGGGNDFGDPETAPEAYFYMQGYNRVGVTQVDPLTSDATKFVHPGDPVTGQGWIDPMSHAASDRRFLMSSGPITFAPGDSQEVVICCLIGQGADAKTSVTALKFADRLAQYAYDVNFQLPSPPEQPKVKVIELSEKIILNWESNAAAVEAYDSKGYKFQGYNIYQGESTLGPWKLIKTYDLVDNTMLIFDDQLDPETGVVINRPVAFGKDNGLQRYTEISTDALNQDIALRNWRRYYFAVTAYGYAPENTPKILENAADSLVCVPHPPVSGTSYTNTFGDTLGQAQNNGLTGAIHSQGVCDAFIYPVVIDPDVITGDNYKVTFGSDTSRIDDTTYVANNYWNLKNLNSGDTLLFKQQNLSGDETYQIVEGLQFKVIGSFDPPINQSAISYEPAANAANYDIDSYFDHAWGETARAIDTWGTGTTELAILQQDYELRFTGEYVDTTAAVVEVKEGTGSLATFVGSRNFEIGTHPMNPSPGSADYFTLRIPFEVWNVDKNEQVNICIYDRMQATTAPHFYAFNPTDRMYCWLVDKPYQETPLDPDEADANFLTWNLISWTMDWQQDDVVSITYPNPIVAGLDEFTVETTVAKRGDLALAKQQAEKINVYPNPYFGQNIMERIPTSRFITFTHLPEEAKIRIFNLAGEFIRTIEHTTGNTERWDLRNEAGIPVASGIYLVHLEMKEIGNKVLKLAILMPQERLDVW